MWSLYFFHILKCSPTVTTSLKNSTCWAPEIHFALSRNDVSFHLSLGLSWAPCGVPWWEAWRLTSIMFHTSGCPWICRISAAHFFFFLVVSGLSCGTWYLHCLIQNLSFAAQGLSNCVVRAPERTGSAVTAHGFSCSMAYGILVPCIARLILNHWTTKEVPVLSFIILGPKACF